MLNSLAFRRVKEGERVSAAQFNKLLETVERLAGILMGGGAMFDGPGGPAFVPADNAQMTYVELETDIVGAAHDRAANDLFVDPDIASGTDPWADFGTDSEFIMPPHAGLWLAGERHVVMRHSGAGKNVLMPFTQVALCVLDGTLSKGGSATASVWGIEASGETDSTRNITVYDWLLDTGQTIASGKRVIAIEHRQSRRWYVVGAQCA